MDGVVLLADKGSNSWRFAEKIRDYLLKEKRAAELPLEEVWIKKFRNGEINLQIPNNMRKKNIYFVHDSSKDPQEWWVELLLLKDALLRASAESITFILPNLLCSRQDRKDRPRVPISARALADSISPALSRIITMDLHAEQIQGFYPETCPVDGLHSFPEVVRYVKEHPLCNLKDLVVASPDVGGVKLAKAFAQKLGVVNPIAVIYKQRAVPGEIGEMILIGDVKDKNVLVVDDLIDSGGTLCEAAKLLKSNGAKELYCYGTHGIFTKGTDELCQNFNRILTSNTHYREPDTSSCVEVVDMSSIFAEAIYRAHKGQSISELF